MMIYPREDERAIRAQGLVKDWAESGLIEPWQRDRMLADLQVDYRRTNLFLRAVLFVFGFLIVYAVIGLLIVGLNIRQGLLFLALSLGVALFFGAEQLIARFRLYRFGIEEAVAVAAATTFAAGCLLYVRGQFSALMGFIGAAGASFIIFRRFGYLYAGIAAVLCAGLIPFNFTIFSGLVADTPRRMFAIIILLLIFGIARERRKDHDWEFPGDLYAALEATAWALIYLFTNLKLSPWLSVPDDGVPVFYWATYAFTWILPAAGVLLAIGDRQRWLLDVSIVTAIVTLTTNKPYLGGVQRPWDPILFGVLMIAIALGLKRWLSSGPHGSRRGFIAARLLASEQKRLAIAGGATALGPGAPQPHTHEQPPAFGGGDAGGAGAAGKF